jgi:dihydrofolate reductase
MMGKVIFGMTMSLDGFIGDRDGSVARLYSDMAELQNSESLQEAIRTTGAVVMGRHSYDMGEGDFTGYEFQAPIFVVTHEAPEKVAKGENDRLTFTFVTDGVESAIKQAKRAAGDKDVTVVGGANLGQQLLKAGLVDEIHIDIMPILLCEGLRMFEHLGAEPIELEKIGVTEGPMRTSLRFRVANINNPNPRG